MVDAPGGNDRVGGVSLAVKDDGTYHVNYRTWYAEHQEASRDVETYSVHVTENRLQKHLTNYNITITDPDDLHTAGTVFDNGTTVVVNWDNFHTRGIVMNIIDASDGAFGEAIEVTETYEDSTQEESPVVAALPGNRFVIAWAQTDQWDTDLYFMIFDKSGEPESGEVIVTAGAMFHDVTDINLLDLEDGSFLVSWSEDIVLNDNRFIYAQRFDSDGTKIGYRESSNLPTG